MPVELSEGTTERIARLFSGSDQQAVARLLVDECGSTLPGCEASTPASLERIRFALLKLSDGDVGKLLDAIALAQTDWRDLLVASGFAEDVQAHSRWWPR